MADEEVHEPKQIVEQYFSCMREGDLAVLDLFDERAELRGLGMLVNGRADIEAFYRGVIAGARPSPSPVGPLLCKDNRVMAEIDIALANGDRVHAIDVFVVEAGRIQSLTYFTADIPKAG